MRQLSKNYIKIKVKCMGEWPLVGENVNIFEYYLVNFLHLKNPDNWYATNKEVQMERVACRDHPFMDTDTYYPSRGACFRYLDYSVLLFDDKCNWAHLSINCNV